MAKTHDTWSKRVLIKIIPHDACSIYKLELTHGHLAILAACIVSLFLAFFTEHVVQFRAEEAKLRELQRVNATQQLQLVNFSNQTNHMWQQLDRIQQEHQEIKQLTAPVRRGDKVAPAPAKAEKPTAMLPSSSAMGQSIDYLPVHGPWWTQAVAWLGMGRGGSATFASESAQLNSLDAGLDLVYTDAVKLKHEAAKVAQVREEASLAYQRMLDAIPSIWPTDGSISSGFGYRSYPDVGFHSGVDIVNYYGAPVLATAAGTVIEAGWDGGFGIKVAIDHGNGYITWYGHNSAALVTPGEFVRKGQEIARLGSTGFATGPHVHYEVHQDGRPISPVPFLSGSIAPTPSQLAQLR